VFPIRNKQRLDFNRVLLAWFFAIAAITLVCGAAAGTHPGTEQAVPAANPAKIKVDYPLNGSVFPPDITAPTFLWHDPSQTATGWVIGISFAGHKQIRIVAPGKNMQVGELDPDAGPGLELTPEQAATHTWQPDAATWAIIKRLSVNAPATIAISGIAGGYHTTVSSGSVTVSTSTDPVGAPIFYRNVPLRTSAPSEDAPIAPLPQSAIPLIKWEVRNISEPESHVVMEKLPTCANCHSFSRDGKTFGLDMDGPRNDKGLYALVPVSKHMTIRTQDMIHWSSFHLNSEASTSSPATKRFGFMSQISPDGRYVVTSIGPPNIANKNQKEVPGLASGLLDRLFSTNYKDFRFLQVFYPTRGILAWYDRKEEKMQPLPGADDPNFVQTSAFWSPDGKYLIFSRAAARDPFPPGAPKPAYANDPREPQIQYDLYKIPFNEGRGGKAVPLAGASGNGMSNNFPKVSPDGKWIVFVQNKNGLLMRPDSRLFIIPFNGGKARLMTCNTFLMNSWHTFSPNGKWLAFSSKSRSPYTQLMLTHIDANGNDTPAILVENTTAANRAVNIPEFVNVDSEDSIAKIDPQATEFYKMVDQAFVLARNNHLPEAIEMLRSALQRDPDDAMAHFNLANLLNATQQSGDALAEFRKASALNPEETTFLESLGMSLEMNGRRDEALVELRKAADLDPTSAAFVFNLGSVMEWNGDYAGALGALEKASKLSDSNNLRIEFGLAQAFDKAGNPSKAIETARHALDLATAAHDEQAEKEIQQFLDPYEHRSELR
jgi:Flp pilus assembly protein TadD